MGNFDIPNKFIWNPSIKATSPITSDYEFFSKWRRELTENPECTYLSRHHRAIWGYFAGGDTK